jgi:ribonuclease P protein component
LEYNRAGFTVSAKLGNAVIRNRIRRQLREIYRLHLDELKNGKDIVVVARSRCIRGEYHKMNASFIAACRELDLLERNRTAI